MKLTAQNENAIKQFAEMIIERMKQMQAGDWKKGWIGRTFNGAPTNVNGKAYQGWNTLMLMLDTVRRNYEYPIYCTLKQANKLGANVIKGSHSTPILFWELIYRTADGKSLTYDQYTQLTTGEQMNCTVIPLLKTYYVFNIQQTNLAEKHPEKLDELTAKYKDGNDDTEGMYANEAIDAMLKNQSWVCPIEYRRKADGAFYNPSSDRIVVPRKSQFKKSDDSPYTEGQEFYATLIHEMVHSTGHSTRLNRTNGGRFGSKKYAKEELIAELGAARCGQELGFDKVILDNNAAYLDSWIQVLEEEPQFILSLMGDVDKASRMILDMIAA